MHGLCTPLCRRKKVDTLRVNFENEWKYITSGLTYLSCGTFCAQRFRHTRERVSQCMYCVNCSMIISIYFFFLLHLSAWEWCRWTTSTVYSPSSKWNAFFSIDRVAVTLLSLSLPLRLSVQTNVYRGLDFSCFCCPSSSRLFYLAQWLHSQSRYYCSITGISLSVLFACRFQHR